MPKTTDRVPSTRLRDWADRLRTRHGHDVTLVLTENRRTMISILPRGRRHTCLRLHHAFNQAPSTLLDDIEAVLVRKDREAWRRVRAFAGSIPVQEPEDGAARSVPRPPRGDVFDLESLLNEVKTRWFDPEMEAYITWGRAPRRRRRRKRRSIRFASWQEDQRLIRVHPALDQPWVPEEFMRYLIHHELCHALAKPRQGPGGRRQIHHADFKELEQRYPDIEKMEKLSTRIFNRIARQI